MNSALALSKLLLKKLKTDGTLRWGEEGSKEEEQEAKEEQRETTEG